MLPAVNPTFCHKRSQAQQPPRPVPDGPAPEVPGQARRTRNGARQRSTRFHPQCSETFPLHRRHPNHLFTHETFASNPEQIVDVIFNPSVVTRALNGTKALPARSFEVALVHLALNGAEEELDAKLDRGGAHSLKKCKYKARWAEGRLCVS